MLSLPRRKGRRPQEIKYKTISDLLANTTITESGCMEWKGSYNGRGYGVVYISGGRSEFTHRAALILSGIAIPKGYCACHKCDNTKCCNPSHLFLGTPADNIRDAQNKGRVPTKKPRVDRRRIAVHGTKSKYSVGCRCDLCTKANTDYIREYRSRKLCNTAN